MSADLPTSETPAGVTASFSAKPHVSLTTDDAGRGPAKSTTPTYTLPADYQLPTDLSVPVRDTRLLHPLVQERWVRLEARLVNNGFGMFINETWRSDRRQQWLYGAGRTAAECLAKGVPPKFARPTEAIVTNAWSARSSAHGYCLVGHDLSLTPAAVALDVVPVGADGKPWDADDPWHTWLAFVNAPAQRALGLVHFGRPGRPIWDAPHLQLVEWSDQQERLIL